MTLGLSPTVISKQVTKEYMYMCIKQNILVKQARIFLSSLPAKGKTISELTNMAVDSWPEDGVTLSPSSVQKRYLHTWLQSCFEGQLP